MKVPFFIWACLAMLQVSPLQATETDSLASISIDAADSSIDNPPSKKEVIKLIPELVINLQILNGTDLMKVELSRPLAGELEWMIYQPQAGVISRITTSTGIDEIKLHNLPEGDYVLRVKDNEGRLSFKAFSKV